MVGVWGDLDLRYDLFRGRPENRVRKWRCPCRWTNAFSSPEFLCARPTTSPAFVFTTGGGGNDVISGDDPRSGSDMVDGVSGNATGSVVDGVVVVDTVVGASVVNVAAVAGAVVAVDSPCMPGGRGI